MSRITLTKFISKCRKFMFHFSSKNNRSRTFCDHLPRILVFFAEYTEWQFRIFLACKLKTNFETLITLASLGFSNHSLKWFQSYLSDRSFRVNIKNKHSSTAKME